VLHYGCMRDTTPSAQQRYFELIRAQSPIERLESAARLCRGVRELAQASILSRHPGASTEVVNAYLAERLYGRQLAERLYPGLIGHDD
jgi:hypothetical protein